MKSTIKKRYERLAEQFSATVGAVPADKWSAPTPCEGWNITAVLKHVVDTNSDLLGGHFDLPTPTGDSRADWQGIRNLTEMVLTDGRGDTRFDGYFGPTTIAEVIDRFYGMDLLVHRWDIARAAGLTDYEHLADADASHYLEVARSNGSVLRMEGVCGPEVSAPDGSTIGEQLLAYLGRDPR